MATTLGFGDGNAIEEDIEETTLSLDDSTSVGDVLNMAVASTVRLGDITVPLGMVTLIGDGETYGCVLVAVKLVCVGVVLEDVGGCDEGDGGSVTGGVYGSVLETEDRFPVVVTEGFVTGLFVINCVEWVLDGFVIGVEDGFVIEVANIFIVVVCLVDDDGIIDAGVVVRIEVGGVADGFAVGVVWSLVVVDCLFRVDCGFVCIAVDFSVEDEEDTDTMVVDCVIGNEGWFVTFVKWFENVVCGLVVEEVVVVRGGLWPSAEEICKKI